MKDCLLTLLGAALAGAAFLIKRWLTGATFNEVLSRKQQVLEIHKSLKEQNLSVDELEELERRLSIRREHESPETVLSVLSETNLTQGQMNRLAAVEANIADIELAEVLRSLTGSLTPCHHEALEISQQHWENYRACQEQIATFPAEGGTLSSVLKYSERERITRTRIASLKWLDKSLRING